LIKEKIVRFKDQVLIMQWKTMKDKPYLEENIARMQKFAKLSLLDYFKSDFSLPIKKKNFWQNLPSKLATDLFIKRYGA